MKYQDLCDGVRAYHDIDTAYGMVQKYDAILQIPYTLRYKDGLTGYTDDLESTFCELQLLGHGYSEGKKYDILIWNILLPGHTDWMVGHCETNFSRDKSPFTKSCDLLRSQDAKNLYRLSHLNHRKTLLANQALDESHPNNSNDTNDKDKNDHNNVATMRQQDDLCIPTSLWKAMDEQMQEHINKLHRELKQQTTLSTNNPGRDASTKKGPSISCQYSNPQRHDGTKAHMVESDSNDHNSEDEDTGTEEPLAQLSALLKASRMASLHTYPDSATRYGFAITTTEITTWLQLMEVPIPVLVVMVGVFTVLIYTGKPTLLVLILLVLRNVVSILAPWTQW